MKANKIAKSTNLPAITLCIWAFSFLLKKIDFGLDDQISDEKTNFRKIQPRLPAKEE
jgi:hypothetical protein